MLYIIRKGNNDIGKLHLNKRKATVRLMSSGKQEQEELEKVKQIMQGALESGEEGASWEEKTEKLFDRLRENGFEWEEDHSGEMQVRMEIPFDGSGRILSVSSSCMQEQSGDEEEFKMREALQKDIARSLPHQIKKGMQKDFQTLTESVLDCLERNAVPELPGLLDFKQLRAKLMLCECDPGRSFLAALYRIPDDQCGEEFLRELAKLRIVIGTTYQDAQIGKDLRYLMQECTEKEKLFGYKLHYALTYAWKREYRAALHSLLDLTKECDGADEKNVGWLYYDLGNVYYHLSDYPSGMKAYLKAGDVWTSCSDNVNAVKAYRNMVYGLDCMDFEAALSYIQEHKEDVHRNATNSLAFSEQLANWYYGIAQIYYKSNDLEQALEQIERAIGYAEPIHGMEERLLEAYECKIEWMQELGMDEEQIAQVQKSRDDLKPQIRSESFLLKQRILRLLEEESFDEQQIKALWQEVEDSCDSELRTAFLCTLAGKYLESDSNKALSYLDQASRSDLSRKDYVAVQSIYAAVMRYKKEYAEEYKYLLTTVPYLHRGLLLDVPRLWELSRQYGTGEERSCILKKLLECVPESADVRIACAREENAQGRYPSAYRRLCAAEKIGIPKELEETYQEALHDAIEGMANQEPPTDGLWEELPADKKMLGEKCADIRSRMTELLLEFKKQIEKQHVKGFWQGSGNEKKWISKPERHAQELLKLYLENRLPDAVVLEEVPSDQGRVDILLVLPPCIKIVLELKMAGSGYPLSYARHAGAQLEEYMQRMDAHIGYVLIFDGRKKENGTGFDEIKTEKLDVVTVNVAFSAPSAK